MQLIVLPADKKNSLKESYAAAFNRATELFVISAYLTEWNMALDLGPKCKTFRIIVGKDYGITRKSACRAVLKWLPKKRKADFLVADKIGGFHPKAVIWKEESGQSFAIIGSSNLTKAAFETNYEANFYSKLSVADYERVRLWITKIESLSVPVSSDWLKKYVEAERRSGNRGKILPIDDTAPIVGLPLPWPAKAKEKVEHRRKQLNSHKRNRSGLLKLFRSCADGSRSNKEFYSELPTYWSYEKGNRLQGDGWQMKGKGANLQALAKGFINILEAPQRDRDDVVVSEIDKLSRAGNEARKAFLSEMLCLEFPNFYPILNGPIKNFLTKVKFRAPYGSSEGARYLDLARKLRASLVQNPDHPAKNLAELDTVIQHAYKKKPKAKSNG